MRKPTISILFKLSIIICGSIGIWGQITSAKYPLTILLYFTIITNFIGILVSIVSIKFTNRIINSFQYICTVSLIIVHLVVQFILSKYINPKGIDVLYDYLLHYIVPLLFTINWLIDNHGVKIKFSKSIFTIIYPIIYALLVFIRGYYGSEYYTPYGMTKYPYFFLDYEKYGIKSVLIYCTVLFFGHIVIGIIIIIINNIINKITKRASVA
jgi:hypothetical protein